MAITLYQKFLNVESTNGTSSADDEATLFYQARTTADETEDDVRDYCRLNLPSSYFGLIIERYTVARMGDDLWDVDVEYGPADSAFTQTKLEVDESRYSIRGGSGGSINRTFSLELVSETISPNVGGLVLTGGPAERIIGLAVDKNGYEAKGIDDPVGQISLTVETVKDDTAISNGYLISLAEYAKKRVTNSVMYKGFAAGTLMIVDQGSQQRGGEDPDWDISIQIEYEPNLTNIEIGNGITVPSKKGHELLDVLYDTKITNTATSGDAVNLPLAVPIRAAVHRLRDSINFETALGI